MDIRNIQSPPFNFSGSIPAHYDQFLGPMFFEPYAIEVCTRIDPASVRFVLEIGSGTGRVTRHLRAVIPSRAKLVASDISPDMLAIAKEKLKELHIDWQIIDAQQLPFDDKTMDLVICCFGDMFVPDLPKAFAEAYRVLRDGGMLIFSTWDQLELNGASHTYRTIARNIPGVILPQNLNLPFSMTDHIAIKEILQVTGFSKIKIESIEKESIAESAKEAANALARSGFIYNEIMKRDPDLVEQIIETLEKELGEKFGASPMIAPMKAVICQAWK